MVVFQGDLHFGAQSCPVDLRAARWGPKRAKIGFFTGCGENTPKIFVLTKRRSAHCRAAYLVVFCAKSGGTARQAAERYWEWLAPQGSRRVGAPQGWWPAGQWSTISSAAQCFYKIQRHIYSTSHNFRQVHIFCNPIVLARPKNSPSGRPF